MLSLKRANRMEAQKIVRWIGEIGNFNVFEPQSPVLI